MSGDYLNVVRDDVRALLAPATADELRGILRALTVGRFDGSRRLGLCADLVGTVANSRWLRTGPHSYQTLTRFAASASKTEPVTEHRDMIEYRNFIHGVRAAFGCNNPAYVRAADAYAMGVRRGETTADNVTATYLYQWIAELAEQKDSA